MIDIQSILKPTASSKISSRTQTSAPANVLSALGLKTGDRLIWEIDSKSKQTIVRATPKNWGSYLRGLGADTWDGSDATEYVKKLRRDRPVSRLDD